MFVIGEAHALFGDNGGGCIVLHKCCCLLNRKKLRLRVRSFPKIHHHVKSTFPEKMMTWLLFAQQLISLSSSILLLHQVISYSFHFRY